MKPGQKHWAIYVNVSESEHAIVSAEAAMVGRSVSDFVRMCINGYLDDMKENVPLLAEKRTRDHAA